MSRLLLAAALVVSVLGCKKKPKPFPPAPPLLSSTATTEGASFGPGDAGIVPVRVATPSSLPTVADTMSPADRAAFEETRTTVRDLEAMAKRGVLTNPDKPDDGDANMKCGSLEPARARLEALADNEASVRSAEAKQLVADERRLCSLEIPIISADKTLKQVTISPSQASRQLMCKYAAKDIDKARKEKPTDRRVRDLEARFARACR